MVIYKFSTAIISSIVNILKMVKALH